MNLNFQINNLLRKFESGNKLDSYRELLKIFKKNKDDNLLRYNLTFIARSAPYSVKFSGKSLHSVVKLASYVSFVTRLSLYVAFFCICVVLVGGRAR